MSSALPEVEIYDPIPGDRQDAGLEAKANTVNNLHMIKEIKQF